MPECSLFVDRSCIAALYFGHSLAARAALLEGGLKRFTVTCGLLAVLWAGPAPAGAETKVVGYSTSWSGEVADIAFARLTHIHYAFVIPYPDGSVGEM